MLRENEWRGTHKLESAEGGASQDRERKQVSQGCSPTSHGEHRETSQDIKRRQASKGHSPSREHRGRDKSGNQKKASKQEALTDWRVRGVNRSGTLKESR